MEMSKKPVYKLTLCAIFIALSTVLSLIKVYDPPIGGSVTLLSMLPIAMLSVMLGVKWGLGAAFVYSLAQLALGIGDIFSWGLTPLSVIGTVFIDYIFAFTVIGLSGAFSKKGYIGICLGTALAVFLRFLCHFTTGIVIFDIWCDWDRVWLYSLCYNGSFMLPELVLTSLAAVVIFRMPQIKKLCEMLS